MYSTRPKHRLSIGAWKPSVSPASVLAPVEDTPDTVHISDFSLWNAVAPPPKLCDLSTANDQTYGGNTRPQCPMVVAEGWEIAASINVVRSLHRRPSRLGESM